MSFELFQIERIAEAQEYILYGRGACVAMVHGRSLGSSGYMTEKGLAFLFWRDGRPWLVSKGSEVEAAPEQVQEIQKFSEDLKNALGATDEH
ncbi:conserved hypothetical protein [Candidatus Sulfopaludibacter sp. SbA3]|nr:conserved hypothetical protein [Candidatus Sulfopaludibacter sp. SbA3]